jgi:two-component system nitrogen regulation response regulator NtrX
MSISARLLVVDDEDDIRASLRGILEDEGHTVFEAASAEAGLEFLERESVDLVFLDIWLPGMDGLECLELLQERHPGLPVLMISGHGTIETAVTAIKKGAHDFIEKPLSLEKVLLAVERAVEFHALKRENTALRSRANAATGGPMGASPVMVTLRGQIARVAPLDTWVLITGENGTGKELAARAIHSAGKRAGKPLVAVNCAAIPEDLIESELFGHEKGAFTGADSAKIGKFEMAHQGTLFLDEIGDMSLKTQAKILRILQEQRFERVGGNRVIHVDVRVIAATNKNLEAAIAAGEFREDLYYRLRVFPLQVPPLRERGDDVLLLADFLSSGLAEDLGLAPPSFSPEAREQLLAYPWPGNVRELRNFLERMIILYPGKVLAVGDLPPEMLGSKNSRSEKSPKVDKDSGDAFIFSPADTYFTTDALPDDFKSARSAFEARFLAAKLAEYGGNVSRLAEAVGLERSYLYRKLKTYNIQGSG